MGIRKAEFVAKTQFLYAACTPYIPHTPLGITFDMEKLKFRFKIYPHLFIDMGCTRKETIFSKGVFFN